MQAIEITTRDDGNHGQLRIKTVGDVLTQLNNILYDNDLAPDGYTYSVWAPGPELDFSWDRALSRNFPTGCWIASYVVTGGSEGWYLHIDAVGPGRSQHIAMAKVYDGWDRAWEIAKAVAFILLA
jgi:hypothetical protein